MPIYEYLCETCGTKFDALRSMSEADALIQCKNCSSTHTHRTISVCFANSEGRSLSSSSPSCSSCTGGNCSSCGSH